MNSDCIKCGGKNTARYYDGALGFQGAHCKRCEWLQDVNDPNNGSYWRCK